MVVSGMHAECDDGENSSGLHLGATDYQQTVIIVLHYVSKLNAMAAPHLSASSHALTLKLIRFRAVGSGKP